MRKLYHAKKSSDGVITGSVEYWRFITFALACVLAAVLWFAFLPYHTFMGDDLRLISDAQKGGVASSFVAGLTQTEFSKYRPVTYSLLALEIRMFGNNFVSYVWVNILLESVNALLIGIIAWSLSRRWHIAFVSGLLLITSRFSYYFILQVYGFMEGMALFFLLLVILTTIRAYRKQLLRAFLWPIVFYGLLVFTHERFILVSGFLGIAILISPASARWSRKLLWASVPFIVAFSNFVVKVYILKIHFLTGAGGTDIAFSPASFIRFMFLAVINLLGFNKGPAYLTGLDLNDAGLWGIALGCALLVPLVILLLIYLSDQLGRRRKSTLVDEGRKALLFVSLILPLLASASITFRQEQRWLYAPYCVMILAIAYLAGKVWDSRPLGLILLLAIALAAFSIDVFYRGYLGNIYLAQGLKFADSAKTFMIDPYRGELADSDVYLITNGDRNIKDWYFFDNRFFQLYTPAANVRVNYVDNINDIPIDPGHSDQALIFINNNGEVKDITAKARPILSSRVDYQHESKFDFLTSYKSGKINNTAYVSTPTGQGVLLTESPGNFGVIKSLTIISGFNYRYEDIAITGGDSLSFKAGLFFDENQTDGALAYVDVISGDNSKRISTPQFVPARKPLDLKLFNIPLAEYAGKKVSFVFGVESPSGNPTADWVSFSDMYILHPSAENAAKKTDSKSR